MPNIATRRGTFLQNLFTYRDFNKGITETELNYKDWIKEVP